MKKVRLGIIGMGNMGKEHLKYLQAGTVDRCELTAICDVVPEKLEPFAPLKSFASSAELIRSGEVDAVVIATPHYDHTTIGIDALDNGVHVLTEKPISVHKADCERLIAAAKRNSALTFGAVFQMRTYPHFKKIKQLVDAGELGEIQRTHWVVTAWFRPQAYYDSGGWRATWQGEGGGVLMNQCPHNLDIFQWICGMPTRLRAFCAFGKYHTMETEDEVTAYLEYGNGATGVFIASTAEAPGTDRLEITGDRGKLVFEDGRITFHRNEQGWRAYSETATDAFGCPDAWTCDVPAPGPIRQHDAITLDFVNAILDGTPVIAPAEEGIHSVELANAMLYSTWTNAPVDLPLDAADYEKHLKEHIAASTFKKTTREAKVDMDQSYR